MLWLRIKRRLKGIGHSRGFGVQSPFAYNFVTTLRKDIMHSHDKKASTLQWFERNYGDNLVVAKANIALQKVEEMTDSTVLLVDGIYDSLENYQCWKSLCADNRLTATFDILYFGVAFAVKGLYKKDYIINI